MKITEHADELVAGWKNGNRSWVSRELLNAARRDPAYGLALAATVARETKGPLPECLATHCV